MKGGQDLGTSPPLMERMSASGVKRQLKSAFAYPLMKSAFERKHLILGIGIALLCMGGVVGVGHPEKEVERNRKSLFDIPAISQAMNTVPPPGAPANQYNRAADARKMEKQNQAQPSARLPREKFHGPSVIRRPKELKIPPGTFVKARLATGASNGLVKVVLLEPVSSQGEIVIEEGCILMGQGSSTEERLFIQFSKLINRDGSVDSVHAEAADPSDKTLGLKGSKVGSRAIKLAAGIGLNFVSGATAALQDSQGQFGATIHPPTLKNAALQGTAQASLAESRELMDEMKNTRPIITVPEGNDVYLLFTEDTQ